MIPWWLCPRCLVREAKERLRWLIEWGRQFMIHVTRAGRIRAAVEELGDTADVIAAELRKRGVMGAQKEAYMCPLANYLRHFMRLDYVASVDLTSVRYETRWGQTRAAKLPDAANVFVARFDRGVYPGLDWDAAPPKPLRGWSDQ